MPDTTVEILNSTVQWGSYDATSTTAKQTLVTTDASTRYVIKDVQIDASSYGTASPSLLINNTKVASLNRNLTGSEIMDVSSTLAIQYDTSGTYFTLNAYNGSTTFRQGTTPDAQFISNASGSLSPSSFDLNSGTSITALTGGSNARNFWFVNGDFYYYQFDGNSTTSLYKRTGGANGSQTTITNATYTPVCFDGVSKFYWVASSILYVYNTANGSTTSLGGLGSSGGTYPKLAFCNGFLFWYSTYTGTPVYTYNIATGTVNTFSGFANYSSSTGWAAFFDSSNSTIRIAHLNQLGGTSTVYYDDFVVSGNSIAGLSNGTANAPALVGYSQSSLGGPYAIFFGGTDQTKIYVTDKNFNVSASFSMGVNMTSTFLSLAPIASPTTAQKNSAGPSMKLRITGVKQT